MTTALREELAACRAQLAAARQELTEAREHQAATADERRLHQVLLNLVGNADKFTDSDRITIRASAVEGSFVVGVADTGPGIPAGEQERIFEEFQQVDGSATRAGGGTGLGLAIARRIVALHEGRIWVESAVGEGSTFLFTVPARVEQ